MRWHGIAIMLLVQLWMLLLQLWQLLLQLWQLLLWHSCMRGWGWLWWHGHIGHQLLGQLLWQLVQLWVLLLQLLLLCQVQLVEQLLVLCQVHRLLHLWHVCRHAQRWQELGLLHQLHSFVLLHQLHSFVLLHRCVLLHCCALLHRLEQLRIRWQLSVWGSVASERPCHRLPRGTRATRAAASERLANRVVLVERIVI